MIFFLLTLSAIVPPNKLIIIYGIVLQIANIDEDITCPVLLYAQIINAKLVIEEPI